MSLWPDGKIQHLVDPIVKGDQIPGNEFRSRTDEFVTMTDLQNFPKALVGIETHTILIGDGDQNEIEKFFQTR